MNILLTGSSGFVGSAILAELVKQNHKITTISREKNNFVSDNIKAFHYDLNNFDHLPPGLLTNIDCVIHSAGLAHAYGNDNVSLLNTFRRANRDITLNLAVLAAEQKVKRFIYISSIKVNGDTTSCDSPFQPDLHFNSYDPYAISKYEAEQGLLKIADAYGMEFVIVRPPLVYGPNVKGNFASLVEWVKREIPLPFGAISNKRSLVAIDNLLDFILLCADRPRSLKAANQVFLVSDGEDVSTPTLLRKVARAYGARSRLLPVPVSFMLLAAKLLGKSDVADRLFGNLLVDSSKARDLLGWKPVITMDEQLRKIAEFDKSAGKS